MVYWRRSEHSVHEVKTLFSSFSPKITYVDFLAYELLDVLLTYDPEIYGEYGNITVSCWYR